MLYLIILFFLQLNYKSKNQTFKNIAFFDFKYNNLTTIKLFIITIEKYIFYCNIYIFINSLKDFSSLCNNNVVEKLDNIRL